MTTLPRYFTGLFLLCFSLCLTGCMQFRYLVRVNSDGSGTVEERMLISSEMRAMMESMQAMFDEEAEPMPPLFDEQELRNRAIQLGEGVQYSAAEPLSEEGFEGYVATYTFSDISKLTLSLKSATETPGVEGSGPRFGSTSGGGARFEFQPGSPSTLVVHRVPDTEVEEEESEAFDFEWDEENAEWEAGEGDEAMDDAEQEMMMEQARAFMGGMRFVMEVEVNGSIRETDARHLDGNRITLMEIDFDRLMDDENGLRTLMDADDLSDAEAVEQLNAIPGIRIEPLDAVTVVFE